MNIEQARENMLKQQIRTWDVLDPKVLEVLAAVPREHFVPGNYRSLAFADMRIPLGHEQVMMSPKEEARMVQSLKIHADDKILEVGTGSGYVTALLAKLGGSVESIDIMESFVSHAAKKLQELDCRNVKLASGNAVRGWASEAPYDVIAITGALPVLPEEFRQQLQIGGRIFVILGQAPAMTATVFTRISAERWKSETLFESQLPFLLEGAKVSSFTF